MSVMAKVFASFIDTQELAAMLRTGTRVYLLDASYNIPGFNVDIRSGHQNCRIPGAKFFEVDEIADKSSGFLHMLPTNSVFVDYMKRLRVKNDDNLLVVYDQLGVVSAPRAWWTFKVFGRTNIAVLNGGLPKWQKEQLPVESGPYPLYQDSSSESDSDYHYRLDSSQVYDLKAVTALSRLLSAGLVETQLVDARPEGRFNGTAPEPRPGVRSGHVPGSLSHFFKNAFNPDGTIKSVPEVKQSFRAAGICTDNTARTVHMCGSGMTACINLLAQEYVGKARTGVYDGSWTEFVRERQATSTEPQISEQEMEAYRRLFSS